MDRAFLLLAWGVVPAFMLAFLVLGLWRRKRSPFWLPVAATVALVVLAAHSAVILPSAAGDFRPTVAVFLGWSLVALPCLVTAAVAIGRGWHSRGALVVAGLAIPTPLMAFLLALVIVYLASN